MSLLEHDKALVKKVGLSADISKERKIEYIDAQIEGIETQLWRSRVDAALNHGLTAENEDESVAIAEKIRAHEKDVKKFAEALELFHKLRAEVEAE